MWTVSAWRSRIAPANGGCRRCALSPLSRGGHAREAVPRIRPKAIYTARDGLAGEDVFRPGGLARRHLDRQTSPNRKRLTRWERSTATFHRYSEVDGLPAFRRARTIAEDHWQHLGGILGRWPRPLPERPFCPVHRVDGAPPNIGSIHVDRTGRLWIGGGTASVVSMLPTPTVRCSSATPPPRDSPATQYSITDDREGRVSRDDVRCRPTDPVTGAVKHVALPTGWRDVRSKWRSATARHALVRDVSRPGEFRPTAGSPRFPAGGVHRWPAHL